MTSSGPHDPPTPAAHDQQLEQTELFVRGFIGLTKEVAADLADELNLEFRLITTGVPYDWDSRSRRINVELNEGVVVAAWAG